MFISFVRLVGCRTLTLPMYWIKGSMKKWMLLQYLYVVYKPVKTVSPSVTTFALLTYIYQLFVWLFSGSFVSDSLLLYRQTVSSHCPLSMWFSRQEYWSGFPFPSPGNLPRDWTCISCIGRQVLHHWASREAPPSIAQTKTTESCWWKEKLEPTERTKEAICCEWVWRAFPVTLARLHLSVQGLW